MRKITIEWSYPMEIDNILLDNRMEEIGLYYITRDFGGKKTDLYIGKTTYSYKSRLESHWWNWIDDYRDKKYVRLGKIIKPKNLHGDELKQLITDCESTLIFCMRSQLKHNVMCTSTCNMKERLQICNTGWRGNLPETLFIPDDEWIDE